MKFIRRNKKIVIGGIIGLVLIGVFVGIGFYTWWGSEMDTFDVVYKRKMDLSNTEWGTPKDIMYGNQGQNLFVAFQTTKKNSSEGRAYTIVRHKLTSPYKLRDPSIKEVFSHSQINGDIEDIHVSPNGKKFFVVDVGEQGAWVREYAFSNPFQISNAVNSSNYKLYKGTWINRSLVGVIFTMKGKTMYRLVSRVELPACNSNGCTSSSSKIELSEYQLSDSFDMSTVSKTEKERYVVKEKGVFDVKDVEWQEQKGWLVLKSDSIYVYRAKSYSRSTSEPIRSTSLTSQLPSGVEKSKVLLDSFVLSPDGKTLLVSDSGNGNIYEFKIADEL